MKRLLSTAFFLSASVFCAMASETNDSTVLGTAESIMNSKGESVVFSTAAPKKTISVTAGTAGDINNDGKLTISDIAELAYILKTGDGPASAKECNYDAANVDGVGRIESQDDLDLLIKWVLTGSKE